MLIRVSRGFMVVVILSFRSGVNLFALPKEIRTDFLRFILNSSTSAGDKSCSRSEKESQLFSILSCEISLMNLARDNLLFLTNSISGSTHLNSCLITLQLLRKLSSHTNFSKWDKRYFDWQCCISTRSITISWWSLNTQPTHQRQFR